MTTRGPNGPSLTSSKRPAGRARSAIGALERKLCARAPFDISRGPERLEGERARRGRGRA